MVSQRQTLNATDVADKPERQHFTHHLDILVSDLDAAVDQAMSVGASMAPVRHSRECACYSIRLATRSACSTEESKADRIRDAASRPISAPRMPMVCVVAFTLYHCASSWRRNSAPHSQQRTVTLVAEVTHDVALSVLWLRVTSIDRIVVTIGTRDSHPSGML
jgi:hypothetical protein